MRGVCSLVTFLASVTLDAGCASSAGEKDPAALGAGAFVGASDWKAELYRPPGGRPELVVTGKVKVASAAHFPVLEFETLLLSSPPQLGLQLQVKRRPN